MTARAFAQSLDVSQKWFVSHGVTPSLRYFSEGTDDITRSKCCEQVSVINARSVRQSWLVKVSKTNQKRDISSWHVSCFCLRAAVPANRVAFGSRESV